MGIMAWCTYVAYVLGIGIISTVSSLIVLMICGLDMLLSIPIGLVSIIIAVATVIMSIIADFRK